MPSVETNSPVEVEINVTTESPVINVQIGGSGGSGSGSGGMTDAVKQALLDCFKHVAWIDDQGQTYYNALYNALYPPVSLDHITAVFNQGSSEILTTDDLNVLRQYLTVTAYYDDSSTEEISAYTLSGELTEGTSTITASYGGKTATFNVTVTASSAVVNRDGSTIYIINAAASKAGNTLVFS